MRGMPARHKNPRHCRPSGTCSIWHKDCLQTNNTVSLPGSHAARSRLHGGRHDGGRCQKKTRPSAAAPALFRSASGVFSVPDGPADRGRHRQPPRAAGLLKQPSPPPPLRRRGRQPFRKPFLWRKSWPSPAPSAAPSMIPGMSASTKDEPSSTATTPRLGERVVKW